MRTHFRCCQAVTLALLALFFRTSDAQVPQIINYQGRVVVGTTNFNGNGQFKFALVNGAGNFSYWSNNGSSSGGSEPTVGVVVPVSNGLYSVQLGGAGMSPISATVFNNSDVRLRVWFNDGTNGWQILSPDQRITAVGYAMMAASVPDGSITGGFGAGAKIGQFTITPINIADGAITGGTGLNAKIAQNTITSANLAAGAAVGAIADNSLPGAKVVDGTIGGGKLANALALGNPSISGDLDFGASTRQMINLYNTSYGIGIQGNTLYERSSGGNFAWFHGGVHSDTAFDPGTGGALTMRLDPNGELNVAGANAAFSLQNRQTASYIQSPANGERWVGYVSGGIYRLWSGGDRITLDTTGKLTASSLVLSGSSTAVTANGTARGLEANAAGTGIAVRGINGAGGDVTINTGLYGESTQSGGNGVVGVANNGAGAYGIWGKSTTGYAGVFDGKVKVNGSASVQVLTITGGADLAEPFRLSKRQIPKGSVVVIDEEQPGHLTESSEPYDKRVAGVISGANGVQPGIRLQQDGVIEGDENVALSGRVYVRAETSSGEIKPGDLLTSSALPGRAMRVSDHARAQGAILGKAMSALKEGEGYVLVLVTLQ